MPGLSPCGWPAGGGPWGLDFRVYRDGGAAVLQGLDFYRPGLGPLGEPGLPFTYPPFAALLFSGFGAIPELWGMVIITMMSLALGLASMASLAGKFRAAGAVAGLWWVVPLLAMVSASFVGTVAYGQVNLLLFGAVYLCFVAGRSGDPLAAALPWVAIGVVAGIKLTPLALLLYPLAARKVRPIVIAAASFLATQLLGLAVLPGESISYWSNVIWDPARVGTVGYVDNLSLKGMLVRWGMSGAVWIVLVLLAIALTYLVIRVLGDEVDPLVGLGLSAMVMLLISPISWVHHFVWWPLVVFAWLVVWRRLSSCCEPSAVVGRVVLALVGAFALTQVVSAKSWMRFFRVDLDGSAPWWVVLHTAVAAVVPLVLLVLFVLVWLRGRAAGGSGVA